jgi:excisionase family DNA binding protein
VSQQHSEVTVTETQIKEHNKAKAVMREPLLGMKEFQERLGVGRSTAFDLVLSKTVRSVKIGNRRLVPESALILFSNLAGPTEFTNVH